MGLTIPSMGPRSAPAPTAEQRLAAANASMPPADRPDQTSLMMALSTMHQLGRFNPPQEDR